MTLSQIETQHMMAKKADLCFTIDYVSLPSWQPNDVHAPIIHYVSLSMKYLCKLSEIDLSFCRYKPIKSTHQEIHSLMMLIPEQ